MQPSLDSLPNSIEKVFADLKHNNNCQAQQKFKLPSQTRVKNSRKNGWSLEAYGRITNQEAGHTLKKKKREKKLMLKWHSDIMDGISNSWI